MVIEISQTEKDKYHMISLICGILKKNLIDTDNSLVVARGWRWGMGKMSEEGQMV